MGLVITLVPALLDKRYNLVLNPFLSLWITSAVFFHALGIFGLYGGSQAYLTKVLEYFRSKLKVRGSH